MKAEISTPEVYNETYKQSIESPDEFWLKIASKQDWVFWPESACNGDFSQGNVSWFEGGQLNLCYNCIDRHLPKLNHKPAIIWEPNDPESPTIIITYRELFKKVQHFANVLAHFGVQEGDCVGIYMPSIPEAIIAMLACARAGAIHSVIFAGFSANSLSDRLKDSNCSILITTDGYQRGNKIFKMKETVDEALKICSCVKNTIVFQHLNIDVPMKEGRDYFWEDMLNQNLNFYFPAQMKSSSPAFILYTSGSTGKPKGIMHSIGGYMVYASYTFRNVFQLQEDDVYWCTADIGWITAHTYGVYGPLLNGTTIVMYEGTPTYPNESRCWDIIDKHKVTIFYTSPTLLRSLQTLGEKQFDGKDLSSLRILGTVGEPINIEAWEWFNINVGKNKLPIVDTYWQTETGGVIISNIAGVTPSIPTMATLPLPGIEVVLLDENGNEINGPGEGILAIKKPWPGLATTTFGDHERYLNTYFRVFNGYYCTGDGAKRDEFGNFRIIGRMDDVLNVSGHRIGTAEVENAINTHGIVIESAVVGFNHPIKGEGIYAFVSLKKDSISSDNVFEKITVEVSQKIGSFAKPDKIQIVNDLPKTRSGKIMRRILRKIADGHNSDFGDTSSLLDPAVLEDIVSGYVR